MLSECLLFFLGALRLPSFLLFRCSRSALFSSSASCRDAEQCESVQYIRRLISTAPAAFLRTSMRRSANRALINHAITVQSDTTNSASCYRLLHSLQNNFEPIFIQAGFSARPSSLDLLWLNTTSLLRFPRTLHNYGQLCRFATPELHKRQV